MTILLAVFASWFVGRVILLFIIQGILRFFYPLVKLVEAEDQSPGII
jgi:hypothetical protein